MASLSEDAGLFEGTTLRLMTLASLTLLKNQVSPDAVGPHLIAVRVRKTSINQRFMVFAEAPSLW